MDSKLIETLGDELYHAMSTQTVVDPLTTRHPDITIEHAYHIQQRMLSRRIQAGERVVGKKIGVTSAAVMNMLGVYPGPSHSNDMHFLKNFRKVVNFQ